MNYDVFYLILTDNDYNSMAELYFSWKSLISLVILGLILINHRQPIQIIISSFLIYCNFCVQQMAQAVPQHIRTIKYKITATIHRVKLSSFTNFYSKVEWKRNQKQIATNLVQHDNQMSVFNEGLEMEYQFHYDTEENQYLEKRCDMTVILDVNGDGEDIKSGGYVHFDLSEPINQSIQMIEKKLDLISSPDPYAYIEFSLLYEPIQQTYPLEMSINMSQVSIFPTEIEQSEGMKTSSKTQIGSIEQSNSISQFKQEGQRGLTDIVNKFQLLARQLKTKIRNKQNRNRQSKPLYSDMYAGRDIPEGITQMQSQIRQLRQSQSRLMSQLQYAEDQKKDLQKLLDKKSKQIVTKTHQIFQLNHKIEELQHLKQDRFNINNMQQQISLDNLDQKEEQYLSLKKKYELQSQQLEQLRNKLRQSQSKNPKQKSLENFYGINRSSSTISNGDDSRLILQKQLANKSHQIGQLFNAAFEIGGAPLLDKLQNAIGLVQMR